MKRVLIFEGRSRYYAIKEEFRSHVVVSYVARFCNHCLRLRPVMDKVSLRFSTSDQIVFNRFDLDQNDFDFLDFDTVPRVVFYPKAVHAKGVEVRVFDEDMDMLP